MLNMRTEIISIILEIALEQCPRVHTTHISTACQTGNSGCYHSDNPSFSVAPFRHCLRVFKAHEAPIVRSYCTFINPPEAFMIER